MSRTEAIGARNSCETLETKLDFISASNCCRWKARHATDSPTSAARADARTSDPNQIERARWR